MDIHWTYIPICYAVAAGIIFTFVYWIEVVLGLPTGENETDTIDQSHSNLKQLVQRIIEEVFKIPELFDHSGVPKEPQRIDLPHFDPKKYEELLATAVLNKLVESYSYERRFENSSGIHSGSDIDGNVQSILHKAQLETLSTSSSNEPRSDSSNSVSLNDQPMSLTATDYIGNLSRDNSVTSPIDSPPQTPRSVGSDEEAYLSDYIQKHKVPLPGIDAHDSDSFDEDYQSVNSNDTEGNWQENWLFKKRKLRNEMKSDIGMLVPSPMEDVKAFIGDKTTDEVSDLSEAGSDMEDEVNETVNGRRSADLPHALIESKTIIGGKNEFVVFPDTKTIDELLQPDSLISAQSAESIDIQSPVIMEAINDLILIEDSKPVVLHVTEKRHNGKSVNDIQIDRSVCVQNGSGQSDINLSTKSARKDVSTTRSSVFGVEGGEPPIPTPRKKSKSLESAKGTVAVEVPIRPKIQESESLPDNNTIVTQIIRDFDFSEEVDRLLGGNKAQPLDDELLDSSINDIYDSIEGDHTLDYQSLIAENESVNTVGVSTNPEFILEARNLSMEDVLTETTQEIPQEQLQNDRFNSLNFIEPTSGLSSNISNESYICKVAPTEFDLSVDSVLQPKPDILDVIATDRVEEKSVHQAMFMSTKPALIAVELASHDTSTVQTFKDDSPKKEPTTSIPTLIISNICGDAPPTPVTSNDDDVSLKPKKVLRAQDSLELPPDDREKFEPTKRVDLFDLKDVDGKINDKLENAVDSEVNCVGSGHEGLSIVAGDPEKPVEEDFVIVTEEEVKALKIEEEESQSRSQESEVGDYSSTDTKPENSLTSASEDLNENKVESPNIPSDLIQTTESELVLKELSTNQPSKISETHITELSIQPESNESIVLNARKVFELATIPELVTQATVVTKSSASSATNTTSNLFTSNQEIILSSNPSTNNIHLEEHGPLPGSIAEREHLKWMNAQVDMPNNPYSPEALQRRLSQTKNPSKVIDINLALAAKPVEPIEDVTTNADNGKPLQIVLGAGEPDQLRYGRDYYINDSKSACGTRKKTSSVQRYSSTDDDNISSKPTTPDSDVFTARIVQIRDDSGHTSDDSSRLKLSIVDRLSDNSSSLSLQSDSIQSDDSETRVYDLRKNETAYLRSDIIRTSRIPIGATATPPPTPIDGESGHKNLDQFFAIKQLNQLKKSEEEQDATSQQKSQTFNSVRGVSKPLSPETLKFFTPKSKPVFTSKFKMEETGSIKPLIVEREDNVSPQNGTIEKGVIEEDVISSLPSVRALAKNFIEPTNDSTKQPIQRPKTFAWQVSNEIGNNTNGHTKEPTTEFSIPNYETRYHPVAPGHSITARSLSTKFREELKHSISDDASNGSDNIEIVEREHSPDRPPSPVLLKGIFKEKMSFFQNLENK